MSGRRSKKLRLENLLPGKNTWPAVTTTNTYPLQKRLGQDCLCLLIWRTQAMIRSSSLSIGLQRWYIPSRRRWWIHLDAEVFIDLIVRHGPPRPPQLDHISRLSYCLKVLVFSVQLPRRQATTIQSLSLTGFGKGYTTSRRRYRLMHLGFPTWLSGTKTQSSLLSSGLPGTTFELDCSYHLRIFFEDIEWKSHDCMLSTGLT